MAYFSKKCNVVQGSYLATEQELLAILEILTYFRRMILGQDIIVLTDHNNLTFPNKQFSNDRLLRQLLTTEEFGAELKYIKEEIKTRQMRYLDSLSKVKI